jgi:hypothetical protein
MEANNKAQRKAAITFKSTAFKGTLSLKTSKLGNRF